MYSQWWCTILFLFQLMILANTQSDVPSVLKLTSRKRSSSQSSKSHFKRCDVNASEPLLDYFNGTDLQWYGNVSFGTPMQTFAVIFDTGSFDVEVPGLECQDCQNMHRFNSTASSTFVDLQQTGFINFSTGVGVDPSDFEVYRLKFVNDTFTLLNFTAPDITFSLITNQTSGFFADPFDGTVGMGYGPDLAVAQVLKRSNKPAMFGLSLTPESIGNAELTLGGYDTSKVTGEIKFAPIVKPQDSSVGFWTLKSSAIAVNGKVVSGVQQDLEIIFDSGTSNCVFPKNVTEALYRAISPSITAHGSLGAYGIPCSEVNSVAANISFTFNDVGGNPFDLVIPQEEFNLGPFHDDPTICQTVFNALDEFNLVGGSLLKHYYSIWDNDNAQMGFSITNFSTAAASTSVPNNGALSALPMSGAAMIAAAALLLATYKQI